MKLIFLLLAILVFNISNLALASGNPTCGDQKSIAGGVDILPWWTAKPFPWDNIQGYWKLGDDKNSFIKTRVLSTTSNRKILNIQVFGDGLCSKPYAKGTGYIDVSEKNVVRALLFDGQYRYQMKLGLFDSRDLNDTDDECPSNVMAVSMQIIGRVSKDGEIAPPLDPGLKATHNMLLSRVNEDPSIICKK